MKRLSRNINVSDKTSATYDKKCISKLSSEISAVSAGKTCFKFEKRSSLGIACCESLNTDTFSVDRRAVKFASSSSHSTKEFEFICQVVRCSSSQRPSIIDPRLKNSDELLVASHKSKNNLHCHGKDGTISLAASNNSSKATNSKVQFVRAENTIADGISYPTIWSCTILSSMACNFDISAFAVSANVSKTNLQMLPREMKIIGRVECDEMWRYISKSILCASRQVSVLGLVTTTMRDKVAYADCFSTLIQQQR